jgi:predicted Fe-Mo cluster-binding NifX family protein
MAQISLIIQARTTSTRLPQKVLKPLPYNSDTTVLEQVISRANKCRMVNEVIVATTTDEEDNQIVKSETVANPGHRPGFLPEFLNDMGVNVIISGGMGAGAIEIFNDKNIEVIVGASGNANEVAKSYLEGHLKSTGSVCHQHQHHDECGE